MNVHQIYCSEKAAPDGSNLYYALLFESDDLKTQLLPLFALHYEITACLSASTDPGVTHMKLNWWSEELTRLSEGNPRHPITVSLQSITGNIRNNSAPLLNYLTTIHSLISRQSITGFDNWFDSLTQGLGQIWLLASRLTRHGNPESANLLQTNGGTIFLLELLQNLGLYISRGYVFLPDELLEQHGCNRNEFGQQSTDNSEKAVFSTLISRLEQQLDTCYTLLLKDRKNISLYPLILNRLAKATCQEIRLDDHQLLKHKIALTPVRKLWIATRTRYYR